MTMSEYIDYWCRHRAMRADEGKVHLHLHRPSTAESLCILIGANTDRCGVVSRGH